MTTHALRTIELAEYAITELDNKELSHESAIALWQNYSAQIVVEFPSPKTDNRWRLTPQGWVGQIPISRELVLRLNPKTKIQNIFRMLEYAYRLRQFLMPKGMIDAGDVEDVFERLAVILSRRVVARARRGFYRAYVPRRETLAYLRGRLDVVHVSRAPWKVELPCRYSVHTADIEDNRILAWTLFLIGRAGLAGKTQGSMISRAFRTLQGSVLLNQYGPESCMNRRYNRLNDDYESMHALCRFFLSHTGPTHQHGENAMLPFLIDMRKLYESFVAEWLRMQLPEKFNIKSQERVILGAGSPIFVVDLVLRDAFTDQPLRVLDTKYKVPERAGQEDIYQIVTYAKLMKCREAILIYPARLGQSLDINVGDVHVRSLTFALDGDLDEAGHAFLSNLLLERFANPN
jgi:5-methylcytosine-specific restriction enzyme subunit McrC